jgi:hypothetical protein
MGVEAVSDEASNAIATCAPYSYSEGILIMKRTLLVFAMAGIYVWIRHQQQRLMAPTKRDREAEANWANEGGGNPSGLV